MVDEDLEFAIKVEKRRLDRRQPTGLEGILQFEDRQTAEAQPSPHALANGFRLFEFVGGRDWQHGVGACPIKDVAGAGAFFA